MYIRAIFSVVLLLLLFTFAKGHVLPNTIAQQDNNNNNNAQVIEEKDAPSFQESIGFRSGENHLVSRYGRTNTAAKVWIYSSRYLRWQIINAALDKIRRVNWANAFSTDRNTFIVRKVNHNTYIVYIPMKASIVDFY